MRHRPHASHPLYNAHRWLPKCLFQNANEDSDFISHIITNSESGVTVAIDLVWDIAEDLSLGYAICSLPARARNHHVYRGETPTTTACV